jgi:lysophospholipase L1-like esterase
MRWASYVAVGDSFTEGLDDPDPAGGFRGWADLVAARLAAEYAVVQPAAGGRPAFRYANLAVRGKLFTPIVDTQVPQALRMCPDLVSFAGGGNDALRRSFDPVALTTRFDQVVGALRGTGADVLLFRFADVTKRLPGKRLILPRVEFLNRAVGEVAERHGARLVDLWSDHEFGNPLLWSEDRLHMSTAGHRRVAAHVLTALGVPPDPDWFAVPPPAPARSWVAARGADVRWAGQHLAPWVKRRLTGRSSGDTIEPKRPVLSPVEPS